VVFTSQGLPIWATTTKFRDKDIPEPLEPAVIAARRLGWRVLDRNTITGRLKQTLASRGLNGSDLGYVDYAHLAPFVNTEINNVLLNMLC
jgi:hypothetical protein